MSLTKDIATGLQWLGRSTGIRPLKGLTDAVLGTPEYQTEMMQEAGFNPTWANVDGKSPQPVDAPSSLNSTNQAMNRANRSAVKWDNLMKKEELTNRKLHNVALHRSIFGYKQGGYLSKKL